MKIKLSEDQRRRLEAWRMKQGRVQEKMPGVYVVGTSEGLYRVGFTRNLETRLRRLKQDSSVELKLVRFFITNDLVRLEKQLRNFWEKYRVNGMGDKWFRFPDELVLAIRAGIDPIAQARAAADQPPTRGFQL